MIIRSKERIRQTAEFFTPPPLVNQMLDDLTSAAKGKCWTDPAKTFLDPACGDGNFLVAIVRRKIANGSTAQEALATTYGVDIMPDNVREARKRVLRTVYGAIIGQQFSGRACLETWAMKRDYKAFLTRYTALTTRNIVCADALTYHFRFDGTK